jgi:hypothetical protein
LAVGALARSREVSSGPARADRVTGRWARVPGPGRDARGLSGVCFEQEVDARQTMSNRPAAAPYRPHRPRAAGAAARHAPARGTGRCCVRVVSTDSQSGVGQTLPWIPPPSRAAERGTRFRTRRDGRLAPYSTMRSRSESSSVPPGPAPPAERWRRRGRRGGLHAGWRLTFVTQFQVFQEGG